MAAAVGMIAGCQKPEMIQIAAPEDVKAPVLEALDGPIEITPANMGLEKVTFSWSAADYGVATQINYSLEAATAAAPGTVVTITSGLTTTSAEVPYETLNQILFNDLKLADGVAEDVTFKVGAQIGEYEKIYSNVITVSCKVTAAEKVYPKLYVVGSYNGWSHDKNQYIFDFLGTDAVYQGMIDFGADGVDHSANEFKITAGAWGNDEHSMDGAHDPESKTISVTDGGGDNINVYQAKRFYHLTYDRAAHTLTADVSFDQIGVIGGFNGWGADVVMNFNTNKQRFYADVEFAEDTEFKFRLDADWAISYGIGADGFLTSDNGGNIPAKAGNYRVYLNMNNFGEITYELVAGMYGKDEPVGGTTTPEPEPEPEPYKGWGLIGGFNGWAGDLAMTSDGTYYVVKGAELEGELKFRKDADWAVNFGYAEGASFEANAEIALAQDGGNINVPAGTYDVYLDAENAKAWFITDGSYPGGGAAPEASEWGVVGVVNGWGATPDVVMYKTATEGLFVAYNVAMPDGGFKIRANNAWVDTANYGLASAGAVEVDHCYDVITGGGSGDMTLVAGNYDIWFDLTNAKVYIMTPGKSITEAEGGEAVTPEPEPEPETTAWYLVGNFNGWTAADVNYQMTKEGNWYVFKGFAADGQGVKFVADASWAVNRGGAFVAAGEAIEVVHNGADMMVAAGTYDVYLNADATVAYFMNPGEAPAGADEPANTWYLVGNFNGWAAGDANYQMTYENGWHVFKGFTADGQGVKLNAGSWDVNRGGTFVAAGEAIEVVHNGADMMVAAGTYDVYLNKAEDTLYFMTPGTTPAN